MKLIITIDLDNDAFNGRNRSVREVKRILDRWTATTQEMGRLTEQKFWDLNGNAVGGAELVGE